MKNLRAITREDIPRVFDAETIERLAAAAALPSGWNHQQFGESVRAAVCIYARDAASPSNNEVRKEVRVMYGLVERQEYEEVVRVVEEMSSTLRSSLASRQAIIDQHAEAARGRRGQQGIADCLDAHRIPEPAELRDATTRAAAAEGLKSLISGGGFLSDGRMRPTGKRSLTWMPELIAPAATRAEPRRAAERALVMWLGIAVAEMGVKVPTTARRGKAGPFARMVAKVLQLVGATGPATAEGLAVELINQRRTKKEIEIACF